MQGLFKLNNTQILILQLFNKEFRVFKQMIWLYLQCINIVYNIQLIAYLLIAWHPLMNLEDQQQRNNMAPLSNQQHNRMQIIQSQPPLLIQNQQLNENVLKNFNESKQPVLQSQDPALISIKSTLTLKREKSKKRRVRQYIIDFTDFLPDSLIAVNRTIIHARIRIGERYQVNIQKHPPLQSTYRPMNQWLIWDGSSHPQKQPSEQYLIEFKELLGQNRNVEELITMRQRLQMSSWREVLQYINSNKAELRKLFHMAQRNRL